MNDLGIVWKKLAGEGRLPSAIRSGDYDAAWLSRTPLFATFAHFSKLSNALHEYDSQSTFFASNNTANAD